MVDDEPLARAVLREYLAAEPDIDLVCECGNGFEAVKAILEIRPDLLLLDIQMPKLDGFEVLELTGAAAATVIFVTAHDEHALRAFDVRALDYLLKPVAAPRFVAALARARERLRQHAPPPPAAELAAAARGPNRYAERLVVRDGGRVAIVAVDALDYAAAEDDYVALVSAGHRHLKQQTIAALEAALDPERFVRIHRSTIVNVARIARLEPYAKEGHLAVLHDGTRLAISRSGYARLQQVLQR